MFAEVDETRRHPDLALHLLNTSISMSGRPVLFLSHASVDVQTAQELKRRLLALPDARAAGLEVFIDRDDLTPGRVWQEELEQFIEKSTAFAVMIGAKGVINWVDREVRAALSRATRDRT
jgi:hypothetical protein